MDDAAQDTKSLSQNRPRRGGQAHFAPKTPQNEPVPDGFGIGSKNRTLLPRFSIRTLLGLITVCAFAFVVAGMAARGQNWAWGVTIGLASLVVTALVHAAVFGVVWLFAQLRSARPKDTP